MTRAEQMLINQEFDKSVRYLCGRGEKLSTGECLQELGHLRIFVYQLADVYKKHEEAHNV